MNQIGMFFGMSSGSPPGGESVGGADRTSGESAGPERARTDENDAAAFAALFGSVMSGELGSEARRLLGELGLDEAAISGLGGSDEGDGNLNRDLSGLSPELKIRLARIQERMLAEHGHEVSVVETVRSQERQLELYAQGRTEAGPVVTWTRESSHTDGRAVDVMIDGTYDDAEAYAQLQRIAREEGLRTLGASDRGHLELDEGGAPLAETFSAPRGMATPAAVARVAVTARVATPGQPAPLGTPDSSPSVADPDARPLGESDARRIPEVEVDLPDLTRGVRDTRGSRDKPAASRPDVPAVTARDVPDGEVRVDPGPEKVSPKAPRADGKMGVESGHLSVGAGGRRAGEFDSNDRSRDETRRGRAHPREVGKAARATKEGERPVGPGDGVFRIDPVAEPPATIHPGAVRGDAAVARTESVNASSALLGAERVADVQDLQLDGRGHRVSRLVVEIPGGREPIGKMDISARGEVVNARIDMTESSLAARLRSHVVELQQGLAARGLQSDALHIRDTRILEAMRLSGASSGSSAIADASGAQTSGRHGSTGDPGSNRGNHTGDFDRRDTHNPRSDRDRGAGDDANGRRDRR